MTEKEKKKIRFENVAVGDEVLIVAPVVVAYRDTRHFWLKAKVTRVTKSLFVAGVNKNRYTKEKGHQIGQWGGYAVEIGAKKSGGKVIESEVHKYKELKNKIALRNEINSFLKHEWVSVETLNLNTVVEKVRSLRSSLVQNF